MDWSNIIIGTSTLIGTLGGLWLGNHLSSKSQIKQSKLQSRNDEKKKWMNDLRLDTYEFISICYNYLLLDIDISHKLKTMDLEFDEAKQIPSQIYLLFAKVLSSKMKVECLLDVRIEKQLKLKNKINELMRVGNIPEQENIYKTLDLFFNPLRIVLEDITKLTNDIIIEETEKLKEIEKEIKGIEKL